MYIWNQRLSGKVVRHEWALPITTLLAMEKAVVCCLRTHENLANIQRQPSRKKCPFTQESSYKMDLSSLKLVKNNNSRL